MTHRILFSRATDTASYPAFDGWGGDYTARGSGPYFAIARQMTDAGEPDGPAVFVDERGVACMTVRSLHACARRHAPNAEDTAARKVRIEARKVWAPP